MTTNRTAIAIKASNLIDPFADTTQFPVQDLSTDSVASDRPAFGAIEVGPNDNAVIFGRNSSECSREALTYGFERPVIALIDDTKVSRTHAMIYWDDRLGSWCIRDLNSSNGTTSRRGSHTHRYNSRGEPLRSGDYLISMGQSRIHVIIG